MPHKQTKFACGSIKRGTAIENFKRRSSPNNDIVLRQPRQASQRIKDKGKQR